MVKRKDSASGVSTDDPTDKSEGTESYFLQPTRHDLLPLVLAIVSIALGLTAALTSYFLLRNNEFTAARNQLQVSLSTVKRAMIEATDSMSSVLISTASFYQVSKTPITLYDQLVPYVYSSGSFPKFMTAVSYVEYVKPENTDSYLASLKLLGGEYANMTIWSRDANGEKIPLIYTPLRCVVTQTVPTSNMASILGFDACTEPVRNATFINALNTGKMTTSTGISSVFRPGAVSILLSKAVNSSITYGAVTATIVFTDLIDETLSAILDRYEVSFYDMNATTADTYMYTTYGGIDTSTSSAENSAYASSAMYTFSTFFDFGDHVYRIQIIPNADYLMKFDGSSKYVALVVSLVIMLILLIICVFIYFARKLLIAKQKRAQAHVQIDLLKTNQTALRTLLDRIAVQESKTRAVINSLTDCICVISPTGKILQTNTAFDETFPFTHQEMEKGVYLWDVFTELASDFFRVCSEKEILTQATRRFGDTVDVAVRVRDLRAKDGQGSSASLSKEEKNSGNTFGTTMNIQLQELEEAFVIIAKNNSAKLQVEVTTENQVKKHEFARKFRDHRFRDELRRYCEINKNVENVLFLERVREFKKAQFGVRVDMKMSIFDQFIKQDAPMQLNLSNEMVVEESIKINKSMGDIDLFKNIEECVLSTLALDIYPRFLLDEQKPSTIVESK
jgi:PAS domain S-box-containing protein